jgi:glycosyltransferase involved in cell wall biosynthesis
MIWEGFHYADSGYGEATRQYVFALQDLGVPVTAKVAESPDDRPRLPRATVRRLETLVQRAPQPWEVHVQQMLPPQFGLDHEAIANVGYTVFEAETIPQRWVQACNRMDEVWVPSEFCVGTFAASGVRRTKLRVIPHGVEVEHFGPHVEPLAVRSEKRFTFLSVFDWVWRKGWDLLVRAYYSEFDASEDVRLVIRSSRVRPQELHSFLAREFRPGPRPELVLLPFAIPREAMPRLYASADAFVVPSRGEGWGLAYGEAMASGLPTIATNWGGQLDFMNSQNAYLIDYERLVPIDEEVRSTLGAEQGLRWVEPSLDHLRWLMRWVFEHPEEAREKGQLARATICDRATWGQAALRIREAARALGEPSLHAPGLALEDLVGPGPAMPANRSQDSLGSAVLARLAELEEADDIAAAILAELRMNAPGSLKDRVLRRMRGRRQVTGGQGGGSL